MKPFKLTSFPTVEALEEEQKRDPLEPWKAKSLKLRKADRLFFPDINGSEETQHLNELQRRKLAEEKYEQELAQQAAVVLEEARQQGLQQGLAQGVEQGKAEGFEQGQAQAQQEVEQLRIELQETLKSLVSARQDLIAAAELDLSEITLNLAAILAGSAIEAEPSRVVDLARQAMNLLAESDVITIRASKDPAQLLREEQEALKTMTDVATLRIVEDPGMGADGCVVESNLGRVDMRVTQRIQSARDLLNTIRNED